MADLEQVYKKLDSIEGKVDMLLLWRVDHQREHKTISRDITETRSILYINPGIVAKVNSLWNGKISVSRWANCCRTILATIVSTGIIGLLVWLLMIYKNN